MLGSQRNLTITEMKRRNKEAGYHWFSRDTMRFFGSVIEAPPNKDNIFITSEWKDFKNTERAYTLRKFNERTNNVETIGEFLQYKSLDEARQGRREVKNGTRSV